MTKSKHHGVINNNEKINNAFKVNGFKVINYIYANDCTIYYVSKDYSEKFNKNSYIIFLEKERYGS